MPQGPGCPGLGGSQGMWLEMSWLGVGGVGTQEARTQPGLGWVSLGGWHSKGEPRQGSWGPERASSLEGRGQAGPRPHNSRPRPPSDPEACPQRLKLPRDPCSLRGLSEAGVRSHTPAGELGPAPLSASRPCRKSLRNCQERVSEAFLGAGSHSELELTAGPPVLTLTPLPGLAATGDTCPCPPHHPP